MTIKKHIITTVAKDEPGVVSKLSAIVQANDGNWLESSMNRLGGYFTGIVSIDLPEKNSGVLAIQLAELQNEGITSTIQVLTEDVEQKSDKADYLNQVHLIIEANDRPGIVEEISSQLASIGVNVENMDTHCESASMAGYNLFVAHLKVALPVTVDQDLLEKTLEDLSDDLMTTISFED